MRGTYRCAVVVAAVLVGSAGLAARATAQDTCVPPPAGLVHWWPANGDAQDIVGGRHGVLKGGAAFAAGKAGQGFSFDGDGDYVELPGSFGGGTELTVAAWVSTSATTSDFQAIVSSTQISFVHLQLNPGGAIVAYTSESGGVAFPVVSQTPTGVFRHVAMSVKSGDSKLYVDGVEVASSDTTYTTLLASATVRIGSGFGGVRFFRGTVDEVEIYDRALSQAEIQSIVAAGAAGKCLAVPLDHFLAYDIALAKGAPKFERRAVSLVDRFVGGTFLVDKPVALLNPADKNDEGIGDADTHLLAYKVKPPRDLGWSGQRGVSVENQLGAFTMDVGAPEQLLVPASKDLTTMPDAPVPASHALDHFLCYHLKATAPALRVSIGDQFMPAAKQFDLGRPLRLCVPVDKNGEGIENPDSHLLCYGAKPAKGEPKHAKVLGVFAADQFGGLQVNTSKESAFCVPSTPVVPAAD